MVKLKRTPRPLYRSEREWGGERGRESEKERESEKDEIDR